MIVYHYVIKYIDVSVLFTVCKVYKFVQLKLHDLQWSSVVQPEWMGGNGKGHREVFSSKSSRLDYNSMVIGNLSASSLFGKDI